MESVRQASCSAAVRHLSLVCSLLARFGMTYVSIRSGVPVCSLLGDWNQPRGERHKQRNRTPSKPSGVSFWELPIIYRFSQQQTSGKRQNSGAFGKNSAPASVLARHRLWPMTQLKVQRSCAQEDGIVGMNSCICLILAELVFSTPCYSYPSTVEADGAWGRLVGDASVTSLVSTADLADSRFPNHQPFPFSLISNAEVEDEQSLPPLPNTFPSLHELQSPPVQQVSLQNGMVVFLMEDHEVPLIKGTMLIKGGAQADPPEKIGLASIVASVQRSGGTVNHPGQKLDEALENLGAGIEMQAGLRTTTIGFSCLSEDYESVLQLVDEVIRQPVLPKSKLEQSRAAGLNSVQHRYDSASTVPRRKVQELLYGRDSPLARQTSVSGLSGITKADLESFKSKWQRPENAVLGIVGDFDTKAMQSMIMDVFQDWEALPGQPSEPPQLPMLEDIALSDASWKEAAGNIYLVDKPGGEAAVMLAEPGISLGDPDEASLDVLDDLLNGFGGRLFDKVRSAEGLTYSVSGGWEAPPSYRGLFTAGGNTEDPVALVSKIDQVLEEILTNSPPTQDELEIAKASAANSFVFNFASKPQQLSRQLVYYVLGLPQDYLLQYQRELENVTLESVQEAGLRHLHPQQQVVVIAGDAARIEKQLLNSDLLEHHHGKLCRLSLNPN